MADADRERLIEILKLGSCPSPYLCDENCKYANLKSCYEERTVIRNDSRRSNQNDSGRYCRG